MSTLNRRVFGLCSGADQSGRALIAVRIADFDDAVVAACSDRAKCGFICTRNLSDFESSPVSALTPEELWAREAES